MKLLIVFVGLALAVTAEESIFRDYHLEIGIPEMERIKAAEAAMDFDGSRVIGGQPTFLGVHPHAAGLSIQLTGGRTSVCGASLISRTSLVTAAHCWRSPSFTGIRVHVVLGTIRFNAGGTRVSSTYVTTHPNYNPQNLNNDVAVIQTGLINFNNNIQPIALATGSNDYVGTVATAVGYGGTSNQGYTQHLRQITLQVIDNASCARVYGSGVVIGSTLCTANNGIQNTCGADSGGSLYIGSGSGRRLIGIISFNAASGCLNGPAGHARVTSFASWISSR